VKTRFLIGLAVLAVAGFLGGFAGSMLRPIPPAAARPEVDLGPTLNRITLTDENGQYCGMFGPGPFVHLTDPDGQTQARLKMTADAAFFDLVWSDSSIIAAVDDQGPVLTMTAGGKPRFSVFTDPDSGLAYLRFNHPNGGQDYVWSPFADQAQKPE
jgi:hypothetical protein